MTQHFKLLGTLDIKTDTKPSAIMQSPMGLAVVAYLIVTDQVQSREGVADLLWDASSTRQALRNLRSLLSRIRKWVPELQITRQTIAFQPTANSFIDLLTLRNGLAADNPATIDTALRLYKGDLLGTFYLPDAPRFNEWLLIEQEYLRRQVLDALRQLAAYYETEAQWQTGISLTRHWLQIDPLDEQAHAQLMQLLAADGQVKAALEQYAVCCDLLWETLGVKPNTAVTTLAQTLEKQLATATAVTPTFNPNEPSPPGPLPPQAILPYRRNHAFVGREKALQKIASILLQTEQSAPPVVAISGMGGLGKTQLAVEFAYRYGRYYPGGVYWLSFADAANVVEEVAAIGSERGMGLYSEADNLTQGDKVGRVLKAWQAPVPRLLIFDNCETHELLTKWWPVTGGCAVLLTTRRANWAHELQVTECTLPVLEVSESIHLLQNLVAHISINEAENIAVELGYLPLALHLAGSFLHRYQQVSTEQYLCQLRDKNLLRHPSLQGHGANFSPTGHELNVARTFTVSLQQLNASDEIGAMALKLLAHAAQFAPSEPIPHTILLATAVAKDADTLTLLLAEDGLARLISLGFLEVKGVQTVTIHRLVAAFAEQNLAQIPAAQTAVAEHIWQLIWEQWETEFFIDQLPVAPAHVRYVMKMAQAHDIERAPQLLHAWGRHLAHKGELVRALPHLQQALTLCDKHDQGDQSKTADILMTLGTVTWKSDSDAAAWPYYKRAFAIYEQVYGTNHPKTAHSLNNLAILYSRTGDYDTAVAHYQRILAIYATILPPEHQDIARILNNLGLTYIRQGAYKRALTYCEQSLDIREQIWPAEHPAILIAWSSIGTIHLLMGDYALAYEYHQKTLAAQEKRLGLNHMQTAETLENVGTTLGFLGQHTKAVATLQQSLAIRENLHGVNHPHLVAPLTQLGFFVQSSGNPEQARAYLERGINIQAAHGLENEQTAVTLSYLADVLSQLGEAESARDYLEKALLIWQHNHAGQHPKTAVTLIRMGEWHETHGDKSTAKRNYAQAFSLLEEHVLATHYELNRVLINLKRLGA